MAMRVSQGRASTGSRASSSRSRASQRTSQLGLSRLSAGRGSVGRTSAIQGLEEFRNSRLSAQLMDGGHIDKEEGLEQVDNNKKDEEIERCELLRFVDSPEFQLFIGAMITANTFTLAGETDFPDWEGWTMVDNFFLVIFFIEIVLRMGYRGVVGFFSDSQNRIWAIFDTVIVALGIGDLWLIPMVMTVWGNGEGNSKTSNGGASSVLRFLRLLRLLRLMRVFRMSPMLVQFVSALISMISTIMGIFVVLFLFLACSAILLTHLLGHGEALPDALDHEQALIKEAVMHKFRTVVDSIFTLFQVTTTDNWNLIARPVIALNKYWRFFFIVFIAFASWIMISVLTAVASDSMIAATSDRKEQERQLRLKREREFIEFLRLSFEDADADGNGLMDKEEFEAMMDQEFVRNRMRSLGVAITPDELRQAWEMLDIDGSGELTIDEFVSGLSFLTEVLSTKHIVSIDYSLKRTANRIDRDLDSLLQELEDVKGQNQEILDHLNRQDAHYQQHELSLWLWKEWANAKEPSAINPKMVLPKSVPEGDLY